jgi:hypothetical protein
VTTSALTAQGVRQCVAVSVFAPGTAQAIVVARPALYGFARMIQSLQSFQGGNLRVFRELAAAQAWLDAGRVPAAWAASLTDAYSPQS